MKRNKNILKWSFDVNTFRLIGRDLITDPITALFELVKNSYDANAENVRIRFINIEERSRHSKIIIEDDGYGMSLDDIRSKWMVIGTPSKRTRKFSPKPYERRHIGEKGIGRFAVDKLGQHVKIRTRKANDTEELVVTIDWQTYEDLANRTQPQLFTDVENVFEYVKPTFENGTTLEISRPRQIWSLDDIRRSSKELSRLVSPFYDSKYPFNISIQAEEFEPFLKEVKVENKERNFASHSFKLNYNEKEECQEYLYFDKKEKKIKIKKCDKKDFGYVKFYFYYFDASAKNRFNTHHKGTSVKIDGIKIYRDGILTTPFAEYEANDEKRRDVLGINKRRWHNTFDRVGTRDCIGYVEITKEGNPAITDSTNRQDFLSTKEYASLKDFIYEQIDVFMEVRKHEREEVKQQKVTSFETAKSIVGDLGKELERLSKEKSVKQQNTIVQDIVRKWPEVERGLRAVTTEYKQTEKESVRKKRMYFSLMSLSLYAANISHAVRTTIYSIKDDATYIEDNIKSEKLKKKAVRINREIKRLLKVVDFMLKYAKTDLPAEYFNVSDLINNVFDAHETIFIEKRIEFDLDLEPDLHLYGNNIFFQDIITNLVSNSIKALDGVFVKKILCKTESNETEMVISFTDNGVGIPTPKRDWVFEVYNTTTPEQGGAGIGLYVVKTNVEALDGRISIVDNYDGGGITFKIVLPFKK